MNGLLNHLLLTLKLNFRSKQAIIYGYVVPIFFLVAFGVVFPNKPPLMREMGALITVTVLGGACFGMPTAMVAERERGVWRRYRLLPTAMGGIILSAMVVRYLVVLSAVILQILLACLILKTPRPEHPWQMLGGFTIVCFSFLGLGLVITMVADNVPSVQALGQAIFLPMIMIGGVGVPLELLPNWVQHIAAFFPGRYAVRAIEVCQHGAGLRSAWFDMIALVVIGVAGLIAGARLFRWDVGQKLAGSAKAWVGMAVVTWALVGVAAEATGRLKSDIPEPEPKLLASAPSTLPAAPSTEPTTLPGSTDATVLSPASVEYLATHQDALTKLLVVIDQYHTAHALATPATLPSDAGWAAITQQQIDSITYDDLPPDQGTVIPLAPNLDNLDDDSKKRLDTFADTLADWPPAQVPDVVERVRNLLSVCAIADVAEDQNESQIPVVVFKYMQGNIQKDQLIKALAYIVLHENDGTFLNTVKDVKDFALDAQVPDDSVRERAIGYDRKFLFRLLGKLPEKR